ncbi:MAG: SDR family NAD(P)-dependent oxidoreductase [Cytophagales bacterium]|nr:SDR family NAD(P)-dependent oxidoreductase [Cytophagales bacterium]
MAVSASLKKRLRSYGPWAIVTGASSGIGREIAERLAEAGLNLVLVGRNEKALDEARASLEAYDAGIQVLYADLSQRKEVEKVIQQVEGLDIGLYVASAGFGTSGEFVKSSLEDELNMLEVNCTALFILTHHFAKLFQERGKGGIILLSSIVGFQGAPYAAHYAATKAYVQSLGEALAVELGSAGVKVLAAAPGPVNTGFGDRAKMQMGQALKPSDVGLPILKALGRKNTVLPGFLSKFLVGSLSMLPRWGKVRVMKLVMGGMTKHQRSAA